MKWTVTIPATITVSGEGGTDEDSALADGISAAAKALGPHGRFEGLHVKAAYSKAKAVVRYDPDPRD